MGRLLILLLIVLSLHVVAMMVFEGLGLVDAIWLTIISTTTIGYGDIVATTVAGRMATLLLICFFGIWLLAYIAGEWIDYRLHRRERMICGHWEWQKMEQQLLIINSPERDGAFYLERLIRQVRKVPELKKIPIQIISDRFAQGLPLKLRDLGVVHQHLSPQAVDSLENIEIHLASYILIVATSSQLELSDSLTMDILHRIQNMKTSARIVVECVQDMNKQRFRALGAAAMIRPIRAYPEMIVRAMVAPGTELFLENLFTYDGDTAYRYDVALENCTWMEVVTPIIKQDLGTPVGFVDPQGQVITNPSGNSSIQISALLILVRQEAIPTTKDIQQSLLPLLSS